MNQVSEKRKLLNIMISFLVGMLFFFGTIYLEDYLRRQNFSNNRYYQYGPPWWSQVLLFLAQLLFWGVIVRFFYRYLVSDTLKFQIFLKVETFKQRINELYRR